MPSINNMYLLYFRGQTSFAREALKSSTISKNLEREGEELSLRQIRVRVWIRSSSLRGTQTRLDLTYLATTSGIRATELLILSCISMSSIDAKAELLGLATMELLKS